ncbi:MULTISPECIES: sodium:solute symporter [unclassified Streptomyces]|uniref:sodium:solute symporter n=1 Tax=unclassified Streptomyces TaxID=2593676 RepID=UPI0008909493|nr:MULTISPECIES: sodium:solute symporter [unclassified Streptomyces]PBC82522.1 SSS family solute:Na+ symporter [Streptomyces sp. 2321.6]SDR49149.1 solute:Na+ symporter, SSS family [Streptomyces sp. KS_16]SEC61254.1 solute:Na+ symporter, SSS family [Streptomyces sp. 2133.1]SNC68572.1 solute:Na+ symporter, SSS family [Streptomyces sp. 2114.4]
MAVDYAVIVLYLAGMLAMGWWGMRRARSKSDFLVAGRRLGPVMYSGTMAAIVLGGASTIGGVGLGYQYGLSGAWMVFTIGLGLLALSVFFSARIARLKVYTVSEMLDLRYGGFAGIISGVVMWAYTLMLAVTSTIAYATIFDVLFGMDRTRSIILGGAIVVAYSTLGGMWSITLTDMVQFVVKTIGVLLLLLPLAVIKAGGFAAMKAQLPDDYFAPLGIGGQTVFTYVLIYSFGMLIGQDIWQRVFTARGAKVARLGGTAAGTYCLVYALAGAAIGTAAKVLYPHLGSPDDAFATIVKDALPVGVRGLVLAAALSAVMSTSSGALIACATVAHHDIWARVKRVAAVRRRPAAGECADGGPAPGAAHAADESGAGAHDEVRGNRVFILLMGLGVIVIAIALNNVVEALTLAYNVLVGGLLVPILGGLLWKRGNAAGALASVTVGGLTVIGLMISLGVLANEPVYYGLIASLVAYVTVSLATRPTDPEVLASWRARLAGRTDGAADEDDPEGDDPEDDEAGDTSVAVARVLTPFPVTGRA